MINLHHLNGWAGGTVCIFIHESMYFKERKDLNISKNDSEILSIEITNKTKNIILGSVYRPLHSSLKGFKDSLKPNFDNIRRNNKDLYLVRDFNVNVLDHENNVKVKRFVNYRFQNSLLISKLTKVTRTNATAIDQILTKAFLNKQIETGIFKTEISQHFPIFLIADPITSSEIKKKNTPL